ncbi:MAG TPA: tryptophan 2,3-dioxygenase family protein, partial [Planctomycetota bacterium]|nr:tryptophan 2,3-dioxygenase family protein [Planctomycetota bacterium]
MSKKKIAGSYGSYLKVPELLSLQHRLTEAHDELQFIVVHQVFELWFKLSLFELEAARDAIRRNDPAQAVHTMRRLQAILLTITSGFDVIETMRPYDFLEFRSHLQPASGFQSVQFREIEFISGLKDERYLKLIEGEPAKRLLKRMDEPTLWDAYVELLGKHKLATADDRKIVASIIAILREPDRHPLGPLTEELIEYDEIFAMWRSRHVKMTMRMIGAKPGTGQKSVAKLMDAGYDRMGSG